MAISKNTRYIYIHAYQSYIWNQAVSERLRRYGSKVLIGDKVIDKSAADLLEEASDIPQEDDQEEIKKDEGETNIKHELNQNFKSCR